MNRIPNRSEHTHRDPRLGRLRRVGRAAQHGERGEGGVGGGRRCRAPPPVLLPSFLLTFVFIPRARFEEAHAPCLTLTFVYVPQPVLTTGTYIVSFSKGD